MSEKALIDAQMQKSRLEFGDVTRSRDVICHVITADFLEQATENQKLH